MVRIFVLKKNYQHWKLFSLIRPLHVAYPISWTRPWTLDSELWTYPQKITLDCGITLPPEKTHTSSNFFFFYFVKRKEK